MKQGRYAEGEAFLRMKGDLNSDNSALWDPAAYRVMFHAHPRTGAGWCIYPTYDYTHCIVDSLENISHSLCTLEFEQRQAVDGPYYWLLHRLALYKPVTWEYSRLNITHTLMSKRKLKYLVTHGRVSGWDDPRLPTLDGLRRRGFSGRALNRFCEEVGVTRAAMTARLGLLEAVARKEMDAGAPRRFVVLRPLKVVLDGLPDGGITFTASNHPKDESAGKRTLKLTSPIYIERDDFRDVDDPKFFGLAPGKEVGLLGAHVNIKCTEVKTGKDGAVVELRATVDDERLSKTKGHLHWVSPPTRSSARCGSTTSSSPEDPEGAAKALKEAGGGAAAAAAAPEEEGGEEEAEERRATPSPAGCSSSTRTRSSSSRARSPSHARRRGRPAAAARPPDVPVPAHRLLLRRLRLDQEEARLQPRRRAARGQGEVEEEARSGDRKVAVSPSRAGRGEARGPRLPPAGAPREG